MVASLFLVTSLLLGQAEDQQLAVTQDQVNRLVRQIDRGLKQADRDEAEEALQALGPAVLPLLDEIPTSLSKSAEVQLRLARVRQALRRARAEAAGRPSLVSLHVKELPVLDVLKQIEAQTGNKFVDHRPKFNQQARNPAISIDLSSVPYWEAVDRVLDAAELSVYAYAGQSALAVINKPDGELPRYGRAVYAGPFRIVPVDITASRQLQFVGGHNLDVNLEVSWEPRLSPIAISHAMDDVKASDDLGMTLEVESRGAIQEAQIRRGSSSTNFSLRTEPPPRKAQQIASLASKLTALVPGGIEDFKFAELDSGESQDVKKAGATVTLQQVRKNNQLWEVRLLVRFDETSGALQSHRNWILDNDAYLLDKDGERVEYAGFETTSRTEDSVGMAYLFDVEGDIGNYTMVYSTPALLLNVPVEFEVQEIPLP